MKNIRIAWMLPALLCGLSALPVFAQKWEVGGGVGGSFYTSQNVTNVASSGSVGLTNGLAASFFLGNNSSGRLGGEVRYDYEYTKLSLKSSGTNVDFGANTHAIHYDFLYQFGHAGESRVRPYVSAGAGIKVYQGTGKENAFQPLSNLAFLTKTSEFKPLISAGAGVKFAISQSMQFRVELRDAVTPFPKNVIAPAQGSKIGGWLQDFAVLAGLSYTF